MLDNLDRPLTLSPADLARVSREAASDADERPLPARCVACGWAGSLAPTALVPGCPWCGDDDGGLRVLLSPPPGSVVERGSVDLPGLPELPPLDLEIWDQLSPHDQDACWGERTFRVVEGEDGVRVEHEGHVVSFLPVSEGYVSARAVERALHERYTPVSVEVVGDRSAEPPSESVGEALVGLAPTLWCQVRWRLDGRRPGAFAELLSRLAESPPFSEIFAALYAEYRGWEHVSRGYRTVAWDMLECAALATFPEFAPGGDLMAELESYAAALREEWKEPGMDIGALEVSTEVRLAVDLYLGAEDAEGVAFAFGLYHLVEALGAPL